MQGADGKWLGDWQYTVGAVTTQHWNGQSVGNMMVSWRQARQDRPDLFDHRLKVWQSPTATVDVIVWNWQ